ncbi:MAG: methyltransferase domain-containing protein [Provencibacterium sp.]|nr:methyltransferase domain-containing protein [Provencibacterium sp.]
MEYQADRISEAYKGELNEFMEESSHKRIDWVCSQVWGKTVLDVGCSQGINAILLGREGKRVCGIDPEDGAIRYALNDLQEETDEVKENVSFICDNFLERDFQNQLFDTIIMGEVLEHVFDPVSFLHKALALLAEGGRLIITVPFGINPHPDHKRTYYFLDLYRQLNIYFAVLNVRFMGGWMGVICQRKEDTDISRQIALNEDFISRLESAFFALDTDKLRQKEKLTQAYSYIKSLKEIKENLTKDLTAKGQDLKETRNNLMQLRESLKAQQNSSQKLQESVKEKDQQLLALKERDRALQEEKNRQLLSLQKENERQALLIQSESESLRKEREAFRKSLDMLESAGNSYKQQIQLLSGEQAALKKKYTQSSSQLQQRAKELSGWKWKYEELASSKLGRIQVAIWRRRGRKKAKPVPLKMRIKSALKKIPFLVQLVEKYRRKKEKQYRAKLEEQNRRVAMERAQMPSLPAPASSQKETAKPVLPQEASAAKKPPQMGPNARRRKAFEESTDIGYMSRIEQLLTQIPESNGGRYYKKHPYAIGIIADEFLFNSFKDAADFVFLTPDSWKKQMENTDFLLVVSAWKGMDEEWRGAAVEGSEKRKLIYEIIEAYRSSGKKTVFYSKEDPPNYEIYLEIAKRCDYIFTTAAEMVERYKADCNNERVAVLEFGINPLYHNPVGMRSVQKQNGAVFSGSWMIKYPERMKDMDMLFNGVLEGGHELRIIDRNYYYTRSNNYLYPEPYWPYVSPAVDHQKLQRVHKLYDWALNINTVTDSMTMFANRVYELQASGNLLISNYSPGVNSRLPMVFTVADKGEIGRIMNAYSPEEVYERQTFGIRSVMTGETTFDRVGHMLEEIGLIPEKNERRIGVIATSCEGRIREMFDRQSYPFKELIALDSFTEEVKSRFDMIAFFDETMDYEMFYLEDMANAFKFTNCDYVTKDAYYAGTQLVTGKEHDYVSVMKDKYRTLFWAASFTAEELAALKGEVMLSSGYSADHFNYNTAVQETPRKETPYQLTAISAVYNNGQHLYGKSFSSLFRSSLFHEMEIILVDDGSTDGYTDKLVCYLARRYPNVRAYLYEDGGSGSASRPRNKGVELAQADYVTWLDPDNEAVEDAYARMSALMQSGGYDLVVGNMLKLTDRIAVADYYHKNFLDMYGTDLVVGDKKDFLKKIRFIPMSIQAMVVQKSILERTGIHQVEGAAGEDTLFSWELFLNAAAIKAVDYAAHIYYAAVSGSTINTVGRRFFERYSLIEKPRIEMLKHYGLMEAHMQLRYNYYYRNWLLKKLAQVPDDCRDDCIRMVLEMHELYENDYLANDRIINQFVELAKAGQYKEVMELVREI